MGNIPQSLPTLSSTPHTTMTGGMKNKSELTNQIAEKLAKIRDLEGGIFTSGLTEDRKVLAGAKSEISKLESEVSSLAAQGGSVKDAKKQLITPDNSTDKLGAFEGQSYRTKPSKPSAADKAAATDQLTKNLVNIELLITGGTITNKDREMLPESKAKVNALLKQNQELIDKGGNLSTAEKQAGVSTAELKTIIH